MNFIRPKPAGRFSPPSLFLPESVAVTGAETPAGRQVMANLLAGGFHGPVLPVSAAQPSIGGVLSYPDIRSLPLVPDLAVIASEGAGIAADVAALAAKGTFAAVVVSISPDLAALAREHGVRLLGPGSFGIAIPAIGLNASRGHLPPRPGRLALVSQSAALCRAVLDWAEPNGVGFSHIVGIGGNADIGFGIVLDWLARDAGTGAILLDIRRIKTSRAFLSAARAAARLRPVVAIRAGARLADASGHAEIGFEAALRRAGVLSVSQFEHLLAAAETLSQAKPVRAEGLAIVTNAIGFGQLAADIGLREGLRLAELSEPTLAALRSRLPAGTDLGQGPIYVGLDAPGLMAEIAALLGNGAEVGGVLAVHAPAGARDSETIALLAAAAKPLRAPLLVCAMGETTEATHRRALVARGVPVFTSPEGAVRGFLHLVQNRRNRAAARELPPSTVVTITPDREKVRRLFAAVRHEGRLALTQDEGLAVLESYAIRGVPSRAVSSPEEAEQAAAALDYPVVVKLRRLERGAAGEGRGTLALDLHNAEEVRVASRAILARQARLAPDAPQLGVLVQHQIGRARELAVRVAEDPLFGPTIGFGQGGTTGDARAELALDLPPLNLPLAHALIARSRVAAILGEFRDQPAVDLAAVAKMLVRVSQLIVDFPEIDRLTINPMFASADGVMAADAWLQLRPDPDSASRLAIAPYPAELAEAWEARGERLEIRPVRPEDAEQHGSFFHRLSPEDVRFRFFSAMRELSPEQIARLTGIDYDREMAFIARRVATDETVGVARLVCDPDLRSGEFAIIVQADMKGRGLARRLMQRLIDWARMRGVKEIVGDVLADNAPMLAFVRRIGFEVRRVPGEDDIVEARLRLE